MAFSNIIDSFFVALGYKVDNSGIDEMQKKAEQAKASMLGVGHAIAGVVAGWGLHKIAEIGSTFEQNRIQIAGFMTALGQSPDFKTGLQDAAAIMKKINADAAKLPGEADDFVEVFKRAFSFVHGAMPGMSNNDIANFTNKLTAVGISWKLDAGLIAREFDHMLTPGKGTASLRLPFFAQLLPYMQKVRKEAHFTDKEFNAMSAEKRFKLLQDTLVTLDPMLAAMGDTWEAMTGAVQSMLKLVTRLGTAGLFRGMKDALEAISALFMDDKGNLTHLGESVVGAGKKISSFIVNVVTMGAKLVGWFASSKYGATLLKGALLALGSLLAGLASEKAALGVLKLVGAFKNLNAVLSGGMLGMILLLAEDLYVWARGGTSVSGMLYSKFKPAIALVIGPLGLLVFGFLKLNGLIGPLLRGFNLAGVIIGKTGAMVGRLMSFIGPLIGQIIRLTAITLRFGIAWGLANLPILLTVGALVLVGVAIYELWKHWDEAVANMREGWEKFVASIKSAPHDLKVAFGFGTKDENVAQAAKQAAFGSGSGVSAPGADVIWRNPANGLEETHRAGWKPPSATMSGAAALSPGGAGGAAGSSVQQTTTIHGGVNIITNEPKVMKRELDKYIRNGQTQVAG